MAEKILLQDILPLDEFRKEGKVLLIRHTHVKLEEMNKKDLLYEYQSFQSKPAFRSCKYIISFLGGERNSGILFGVFKVEGILEKEELPKYPEEMKQYCREQNPDTDFYLQLRQIELYNKFTSRLVIDWVVNRGWQHEYGKVKEKEVIKLLPMNFVKDFPGLQNVKLTYSELKNIIKNPESHAEWYHSLSKLQAVYLILYNKTGSQYVGTTYGMDGLWQRWESYINSNGTGGNKKLEILKSENDGFVEFLQFSILEVLSKTADQKYCTKKETLWKDKLGSKANGLNLN